jgi:hydroxyacylglutathione hydrolase
MLVKRTAVALAATLIAVLWGVDGGAAPARPPTPPDWFHIIPLDAHTYALSEPKYWQQNVSYLLIGTRQALLFDTGPGIYSIREVVEKLTSLPVIAIPTHLHFDHVGDLEEFGNVWLLDTPALRAQVKDGWFVEPPGQYLVRSGIRYRVRSWFKDGQTLNLGDRTVTLLSIPGHTEESVGVLDAGGTRLFSGDIVNRMVSLVDVPGSDVSAMARSLARLVRLAKPGAVAYEAHAEAPLTWAELNQLAHGVAEIAAGRATWTPMCLGGVPTRRYAVGAFPILLPATPDARLPPFGSVTETLDWEGGACEKTAASHPP